MSLQAAPIQDEIYFEESGARSVTTVRDAARQERLRRPGGGMAEVQAASAGSRSVVAGASAASGRIQSRIHRAIAGRARARRREPSQAAVDVADVRTVAQIGRASCRERV